MSKGQIIVQLTNLIEEFVDSMKGSARYQALAKLREQFNTEFKDNGYKSEFKPDGYLTQCNFGGLLVIVGNSGESVIVWSDWSDDAISEKLTECEILTREDDDSEEWVSGFEFQSSFYSLNDVMRIN